MKKFFSKTLFCQNCITSLVPLSSENSNPLKAVDFLLVDVARACFITIQLEHIFPVGNDLDHINIHEMSLCPTCFLIKEIESGILFSGSGLSSWDNITIAIPLKALAIAKEVAIIKNCCF